MRVVLIGMKGCGKTTVGWLLAKEMQVYFIDSDAYIEKMHQQERGEVLPFREVFKKYGGEYFRALDTKALRQITKEFENRDFAFACGGQTPLREENQEILSRLGKVVFLEVEEAVLLRRILAQGVPAFFPYQDDPERSLHELLAARVPVYRRVADITIDASSRRPEELTDRILAELRGHDKH